MVTNVSEKMEYTWKLFDGAVSIEQSHRSFKSIQDCIENFLLTNQVDLVLDESDSTFVEFYSQYGNQILVKLFWAQTYDAVEEIWASVVYKFKLDYLGNVTQCYTTLC